MTAISREVMGQTVPRSHVPYVATGPSPRQPAPRGVVLEFWRAMESTSRRTAEREFQIFRDGLECIVGVCRRAGAPDFLATLFGDSDAARAIAGAPLQCNSHFACLIQRDVLATAGSLTDYVAAATPEHCADLKRRAIRLRCELDEIIAAVP